MTLHVPDVTDLDTLGAALAYARDGFYVGPCARGTKHPGSILGNGWQTRTSRDPEMIVSWFAGTDHGVFIHPGRSGAVVFDVDAPEKLHPLIAQAVLDYGPPWQSTRPDTPARRHYLFEQPPGRTIGNSVGRLTGGWGEVRGTNGCIIVAPSLHEDHTVGARYAWGQVGPLPVLPLELAGALDDSLGAEAAVTDEEVRAFLAEHDEARRPEVLDVHVLGYRKAVTAGESRHQSMCGHLAGAMREARLGLYPAQVAADTLESEFLTAVTAKPISAKQGEARTPSAARSEWAGLVAWAVAQAVDADLDAVAARVADKVPDPTAHLDLLEVHATPPPELRDPAPDAPEVDDTVRKRFPRLDLAGLLAAERPEREWVIDGLVPAGASVSLVAPAGTGKSLLLLASMIAVARGDRRFAGLSLTRRRVLLVDMENTEDDLADRLRALGITPDNAGDLSDLIPIHLPALAPLDTSTGAIELAGIIHAYGITRGDVVVLDSLQRVTSGPENDSDTLRAYYRHTGSMLKRLGLTVIRTDNTGKDADKGARGTSGKRDDVDVELLVVPDGKQRDLFHIRPGKVRLPGIEPLSMKRYTDDDGLLHYSTQGDPFRAAVVDCLALLDQLGLPIEAGERKAVEGLRNGQHKMARNVVRQAVKERKAPTLAMTTDPPESALPTLGAPPDEDDLSRYADQTRRTPGAPPTEAASHQVSGPFECADTERRTPGAPTAGAPAAGAPPLPLSEERRTGAHDPEEVGERGADLFEFAPLRPSYFPGPRDDKDWCRVSTHSPRKDARGDWPRPDCDAAEAVGQ